MDHPQNNNALSWQEQRQEAIRRQQQRWQQLHPEASQRQQQAQPQQPAATYPSIPAVHADAPLPQYPAVPRPSAPPLDAAGVDWAAADAAAERADWQRREQQEQEDHRLAMQLAEQFAAEEDADEGLPVMELDTGTDDGDDDDDWEQIARTASMAGLAGNAAAAAAPGGAATHASGAAPRPSSQAAAAAGSAAGGALGAGLSALLAMAADAAVARARQNAAAAGGNAAGPQAQQGPGHAAAAATAAGSGAGSSSSGGQGVLGMAANALRSVLASRAANQASSSAAASSGSGGSGRRWEDEQPNAEDLAMLQNVMQALMGGSLPQGFPAGRTTAAAAAGNAGGQPAQASGSGSGNSEFRVTRLPGGGYSAVYTSTSGSGSVHVHTSGSHVGGGDPSRGMEEPFAGPDDFLSQLLLAGARSARDGRGRPAGYTHFDPASGASQFEPLGRGTDLEGLLGQIMGPGVFGQGGGGMRYEDLVGLDPVQVTTPAEVLSSLPQSEYVEGRKPGDSDTCVICQSAYTVGEDLTHLPCLHAFHTECITPWLQGHSRKCPVCKTDVC